VPATPRVVRESRMACAMLNIVDAMFRLPRTSLVLASIPAFALVLVSGVARAQTVASSGTTTVTGTTTGATVSLSQQLYPERFLNYGTTRQVDLGQSTRPQNLNPLGISYEDCIQDQTLQFEVQVSGFDGSENLEVWATRSGDCTADTTRGQGAATATCWKVSDGIVGKVMETSQTVPIAVRVQDIVGPQNAPPFPPTLVHDGASACNAQQDFVAVPMNIFFVPVASDELQDGTSLNYTIPGGTDLVGPPPPIGVSIADGDTLFVVNWTPNSDSDTGGYNLFIDPPLGSVGKPLDAATTVIPDAQLFCPDVGAPALPTATEAGDDGAPGDASSADADASDAGSGCYLVNVGGGGGSKIGSGTCASSVLASGIVQDSSTTTTTFVTDDGSDEAGEDSGIIEEQGSGGISTIPCQYGVGNLCGTTNLTVTGETNSTYTITGLTNGTTYTVALAAVDNFGNVGPPSTEACDFPAPVNDFWKIYRTDGGQAGGGFCALEAVGAPVGSTLAFAGAGSLVLATVRRRRRKRR
jgi:hypothetical protein